MNSTIRFLHQYLRPRADAVEAQEITYRRGDEALAATLLRPVRRRGPLPGWVLLHGLTCPGRNHASLQRYARAVAASGAVVLLPDLPEWRRLEIAPSAAVPTIQAAILALANRDDTLPGRTGLMGFSFGATQALVAAADPRIADTVSAVVAWGGYGDPHRVIRFGLTGEHELDGDAYRLDPDPYGRWIIAGNYLHRVPGLEDARVAADALHRLALEAGHRGVYAWDPVYDPVKAELRTSLPADQRELFDLLAPPASRPVQTSREARQLASAIAQAAVKEEPLLDPAPFLPRIASRALVAHGRDDRLVPFTEAFRLSRALPPNRCQDCTITGLFSHSGGTRPNLGLPGLTREAARFIRVLHRIIHLP